MFATSLSFVQGGLMWHSPQLSLDPYWIIALPFHTNIAKRFCQRRSAVWVSTRGKSQNGILRPQLVPKGFCRAVTVLVGVRRGDRVVGAPQQSVLTADANTAALENLF